MAWNGNGYRKPDANELKKRLDYVLGAKGTPRREDPEVADEETSRGPVRDLDEDLRSQLNALSSPPALGVDEDEEDALSFFQKLAEE